MLKRERIDTNKFVRTSTPWSLTILIVGLSAAVVGFLLVPRFLAGTRLESWGYLGVAAVVMVCGRASRNAMVLRTAIDDRLLSDADQQLKRKLRLSLTLAGYALVGLAIILFSAVGYDFNLLLTGAPWVKTSLGLLIVAYGAIVAVGYVYARRFFR